MSRMVETSLPKRSLSGLYVGKQAHKMVTAAWILSQISDLPKFTVGNRVNHWTVACGPITTDGLTIHSVWLILVCNPENVCDDRTARLSAPFQVFANVYMWWRDHLQTTQQENARHDHLGSRGHLQGQDCPNRQDQNGDVEENVEYANDQGEEVEVEAFSRL